jgi:hypothetical protein
LARSGNARVRRGMIQLAWRFLMFQKDSALAKWYRQRTANAPSTRKTLVVALARKLLIALWRSGARRRRARRCTAASRRLIEKPADVVVPSYGFAPIRSALMGSR